MPTSFPYRPWALLLLLCSPSTLHPWAHLPLLLQPRRPLHAVPIFPTAHCLCGCGKRRGGHVRSRTARVRSSVSSGKSLGSSCLGFPICTVGPLVPAGPLPQERSVRRCPRPALVRPTSPAPCSLPVGFPYSATAPPHAGLTENLSLPPQPVLSLSSYFTLLPTDLSSESVLRFSPLLTTRSRRRLIVPLKPGGQQGPPAPREHLRERKQWEVLRGRTLERGGRYEFLK